MSSVIPACGRDIRNANCARRSANAMTPLPVPLTSPAWGRPVNRILMSTRALPASWVAAADAAMVVCESLRGAVVGDGVVLDAVDAGPHPAATAAAATSTASERRETISPQV